MGIEPKNDPRSRRTRRLLQAALNELLQTKKFHEITVQDITAQAEINRATFYAHFVDKYDLLNAGIRDSFQTLLSQRIPERHTFTLANLRILALTAHEYLAGFAGHCASSSSNDDDGLMVRQVQRQLHAIVLEWLRQTPVRPNTPNSIEVTAMVVSWAIFGSILEVAWNSRKISSEQLVSQILALLEPGIRDFLEAQAVR